MGTSEATMQYRSRATSQTFRPVATSMPRSLSRLKGMWGPAQIATPTSGRKIAVAQPSESYPRRSKSPMATGSARYSSDEVAMAPPAIRLPSSNWTTPTKALAVMSVKTTTM